MAEKAKSKSRYITIKHTEYESRGSAPVYIDTTDVLCDTVKQRTVMRLRVYNNGSKTVKSAYFNAGCFDKNLNLCVQLKNIPYINSDAGAYSYFGDKQLVEVPDITESVFVEISKVLFDDGSGWINENQKLDQDIVSENAVGDDWNRLRTTKAIRERQEKLNQKPGFKKRLPFSRRVMIWIASILAICLLVACVQSARGYFSKRQECYTTAMNYYINRDFSNAAKALYKLDSEYKYFGSDEKEIRYCAAIANMHIGDYRKASEYFMQCGNYKHSVDNLINISATYGRLIAAGTNHSAVVSKNGTVSSFGDNSRNQCNTGEWLGIIGVSASGNHTVGVAVDGKMIAAGDNDYGQCDVGAWTDVVQAATGDKHTAALRTNGRVIARGNNKYGQCDVQEWKDITLVAASANHTVGLRSDGTVTAVGWNNSGQCDVADWSEIAFVATGDKNTVGVKYDGTVVAVGDNSRGQCDTSGLNNIVSASVGNEYIVYVDVSGKVISRGLNDSKQGAVSLWNDIMAVSCGTAHTIGISNNGTVSAVGDERDGKLNISNIGDIGAENISIIE